MVMSPGDIEQASPEYPAHLEPRRLMKGGVNLQLFAVGKELVVMKSNLLHVEQRNRASDETMQGKCPAPVSVPSCP